jgi:hypothetical protein
VLLKARVGSSLEKKRLRDQQKALVERFATSAVAHDVAESGFALGAKRVPATVMFTDIRGFTTLVEQQGPEKTIELLNTWYTLMFDAFGGQGGRVATEPLGPVALKGKQQTVEVSRWRPDRRAGPRECRTRKVCGRSQRPVGTARTVAPRSPRSIGTATGDPIIDVAIDPAARWHTLSQWFRFGTMLVHAMADARCLIVQPRRA